jgi:hypothetical protein
MRTDGIRVFQTSRASRFANRISVDQSNLSRPALRMHVTYTEPHRILLCRGALCMDLLSCRHPLPDAVHVD